MKFPLGVAIAVLLAASGTMTDAASCDPGKPGFELTPEEAQSVYDCLKDSLVAGYKKGNKRWIPKDIVADYRDWVLVSKFPAVPGFHGGRFLTTYVNPTGAAIYMEY